MENQDNNNLNELEQLKAQFETLKEQLDQQEIVNDRLMKSSIKHSTDFYKRYRRNQIIIYPIVAILGLLSILWIFGNNLSLLLFWLTFCVVCFVFELWMTRDLQTKTKENNDLLTLSNQARSFKKLYSIFVVLSITVGIMLVAGSFLSMEGKHVFVRNMNEFIMTLSLLFVLLLGVGIIGIRYVTRPCDEIILQIEACEDPMDKKTGFDKEQKWLCIAMIVAFIGLDIWAYKISISHFKFGSPYYSLECKRGDGNLTTEGKLEIWEIYDDTLVNANDVAVVKEYWQKNDSLVLMMERNTQETDGQQQRLYALKKTTEEGPAISSAVLGGQPVVDRVTVTYGSKNRFRTEEPLIYVYMTPAASNLWYKFTENGSLRPEDFRAAVCLDGMVYQDWLVNRGISNGLFFFNPIGSREEVEAFCGRLVKQ